MRHTNRQIEWCEATLELRRLEKKAEETTDWDSCSSILSHNSIEELKAQLHLLEISSPMECPVEESQLVDYAEDRAKYRVDYYQEEIKKMMREIIKLESNRDS